MNFYPVSRYLNNDTTTFVMGAAVGYEVGSAAGYGYVGCAGVAIIGGIAAVAIKTATNSLGHPSAISNNLARREAVNDISNNLARREAVNDIGPDLLGNVFSYLGIKDLNNSEKVCKIWIQASHSTKQWENQCRIQLGGIPDSVDPRVCLPASRSCKEGLGMVFHKIHGAGAYRRLIGADIRPGPPPISRWDELDPCDPTKRVIDEYELLHCPRDFYIRVPRDFPLESYEGAIEVEGTTKNKVLQVPDTINNCGKVFKHPKTGNSLRYKYIWVGISEQYGNERIQSEWIYIRKHVIGKGLPFANQQALARDKGVIIPKLISRILFNFLKAGCSDKNVYPDGADPYVYARTSTTIQLEGRDWPSGCGDGSSFGLRVHHYFFGGYPDLGVGVGLAEVQATST